MKAAEHIQALLTFPQLLTLGLTLSVTVTVWAQNDNAPQSDSVPPQQPVPAMVGVDTSATPADSNDTVTVNSDRMVTPPPVSGQPYPIALTSEERSNYLRGGVAFTGAYSDNVLGELANGHPVGDESYSVAPFVSLDETTHRVHALLTYAPGFTFYQYITSRNEQDQNASVEFEYRLSPHVTFSANDSFQKSSNVFNQPPDLTSGVVSGGAEGSNFSVIAPIADRLSNFGNVGLNYQFELNDMFGVSGAFSNLHYPDPAEVPGLYDSESQSGLAFYSHRFGAQYVGVTYQYQRLLAYPTIGLNETQTHAALLFYTFAPMSSRFSFSIFGGPQYSDTTQPSFLPLRSWTPAGGVSLGWRGRLNSFAIGYTHIVASGGGLIGAVQQDSATVSVRQQLTRTLSTSISGGYAQNDVLESSSLGFTSGHSLFGTVSLQQLLGQHLSVILGYSRIHQDYSAVEIISTTPNTNREFVSIAYQFSRPIGR